MQGCVREEGGKEGRRDTRLLRSSKKVSARPVGGAEQRLPVGQKNLAEMSLCKLSR